MKCIRFIVLLLMVIGALNWGLVGFFQYDLVSDLFGGMSSTAARVIYALIGIAGLLGLKGLCKNCGCCGGCGGGCNCSGCGCRKGE
jgi:uncharacterized membrane protein YuzA (DUF378 family)